MAAQAVRLATIIRKNAHFSVECLLLLILLLTLGNNLWLRTNSASASMNNQSLFFVHLKTHPNLNSKLVETSEVVNVKLAQKPNDLSKQILAASTIENREPATTNINPSLPSMSGSVLLKPNPATSDAPVIKRDIEVYQVRGGDTVSRIASAFGVSVDTILWENNLSEISYIHPGQELKILPVSGVRHIIKEGETISSIAKKYGVDTESIFEYNGIEFEEHIFPGEEIIIPNGVKSAPQTPARSQYLADLQRNDYERAQIPADYQGASSGFIWPVPASSRISQYFWSRHRALDIPCKDCEIVASGDGIVEISGWQSGGYGYTILLNHGNGLTSRYAHGSKLFVSAGEQVSKGQVIMISGSTGRSSGPHLHFEIKKNGVFLNPLNLVSR